MYIGMHHVGIPLLRHFARHFRSYARFQGYIQFCERMLAMSVLGFVRNAAPFNMSIQEEIREKFILYGFTEDRLFTCLFGRQNDPLFPVGSPGRYLL